MYTFTSLHTSLLHTNSGFLQSKTIHESDSRFTAVQFRFRNVEGAGEESVSPSLPRRPAASRPRLYLSTAEDPFQSLQDGGGWGEEGLCVCFSL